MAKIKRAAEIVRAPQSREEAERMLARLGEIHRDQAVIAAALDERVAAEKSAAEAEARPLAAEAETLTRALQLWAEANRAALTEGGRTKTVRLATGEIMWRARPPRVGLRDVAAVIEALAGLGLERFLRTRTEVNREAMLAEPGVARQVPGVAIGSAGEEIVVAPTALRMAEVA